MIRPRVFVCGPLMKKTICARLGLVGVAAQAQPAKGRSAEMESSMIDKSDAF